MTIASRQNAKAPKAPCKALLAALATSALPLAASAEVTATPWLELVHACVDVIVDQSFRPLEGYPPAPFTAGLPGRREYSVHNASRTHVVVATLVRDGWVDCHVRESVENDRSRWRAVAAAWSEAWATEFPRPEFVQIRSVFNPDNPFPGALRCGEDGSILTVMPTLRANLHFRVEVTLDATERGVGLCAESASQR